MQRLAVFADERRALCLEDDIVILLRETMGYERRNGARETCPSTQ